LRPVDRLAVAARALCLACLLAPAPLLAQAVSAADLQKRANAILTLMGFSLTPDVTTGALAISDQSAGDPYFRQTSISGGGSVSKNPPLYLEGTLAYSRYDPDFASSGQARFPLKWDSVMATGGVGWDFPVAKELMLRPIFNLSVGRVESEGTVTPATAPAPGSRDALDFLDNGRLNAFGLGGSVMLDYERYRPENEVDFELRYTYINLQSFDSSQSVEGHANAQTVSLWSRYREPTRFTLLERPLRYVLEYAYTSFLGDLRGVLGFTDVHSFGAGLELDSSNYDVYVTRTRLLVRYKIGNNVTGWAVGLGLSF
jgi:Autotransporter beta-domain